MRKTVLFVMLLCGCSGATLRQRAADIAMVNKQTIDAAYAEWDARARERHQVCLEQYPPATSTQMQFDDCIVPFTLGKQELVTQALGGVVEAQKALELLLVDEADPESLRAALLKVKAAVIYFFEATR